MILYFDFDGTIADTAEGIARAIALAFEAHRLPPPTVEEVKQEMGFPLTEILSKLAKKQFTAGECQSLILTYRKFYHEISGSYIHLIEGMGGVIKECAKFSEAMAIVTNKISTAARRDAQEVGLLEYFEAIVGSDMAENQKPARDPLQTARRLMGKEESQKGLVIGDSSADMLMAKADGLPCVGVTWGAKTEDVLRDAGATYIAHTPQALLEIIRKFAAS